MALYEVQFRINYKWHGVSVWNLEPRNLSRFLDHLFRLHNSTYCEESKAMLRVQRIPYEYGFAEWDFDGGDNKTGLWCGEFAAGR